jgi:hypothetical protein
MQNIDPLFILQPVIVIIIATGLMVYWYFKRRFHPSVWLYSFAAYATAIALKYAVQIPTNAAVTNYFGANSVGLGVYYGLQTVIFEVGIAYAIAWYTVFHSKLGQKDAEAYGSGLAFWENASLLGVLPLINLISYYAVLSANDSLAQTLYTQLRMNAPGLFASSSAALSNVALGVVERVSSIMIHVAWGYLCLMAVVYHKKWLFLIALPMGLVDFLVPFAQYSIILFEAVVFVLALISVSVAWYAVKGVRKKAENQTAPLLC